MEIGCHGGRSRRPKPRRAQDKSDPMGGGEGNANLAIQSAKSRRAERKPAKSGRRRRNLDTRGLKGAETEISSGIARPGDFGKWGRNLSTGRANRDVENAADSAETRSLVNRVGEWASGGNRRPVNLTAGEEKSFRKNGARYEISAGSLAARVRVTPPGVQKRGERKSRPGRLE